jgi:hypothetical protein
MAYQAKDIQKILRIPKIRYEYLARQIGITPEIEEAEGTGNVHKYSFKNLMEFAIAERCSLVGLSMKHIRFLLQIVHKHANPKIFELMEGAGTKTQKETINFEVWFDGFPGGGLFFWAGEDVDACVYRSSSKKLDEKMEGYYSNRLELKPEILDSLKKYLKKDTEKAPLRTIINDSLDVFIHINIGKIRWGLSTFLHILDSEKKQG